MNANPYAPPAAPPPMPQGPAGPYGQGPIPWTATDLIGRAWGLFKPYWAVIAGAMLVVAIAGQIPGLFPPILVKAGVVQEGDLLLTAMNLVTSLVGWVISAYFNCGMIMMTLKVARGEVPAFGDAFSGARYLPSMLGVNFLTGLIVAFGLLLLIVPGIIAIYGLLLAPYFVVDQEMGAIDALQASWRATKGQKGSLWVLSLLGGLLLFAGLLACGVGVLVAMPVYTIALTLAYLHISGRIAPELPPSYAYGYGPPPYGGPPGYGPPGPPYGPPPGPPYGPPPGS